MSTLRETHQTYRMAHTAKCKLQMAADRPDRNLRFILGHAFTLDKLMLRVVEIESAGSSHDDDRSIEDTAAPIYTGTERERRVSFSNPVKPVTKRARTQSPSPAEDAQIDNYLDSSSDEIFDDDEAEEEGLSLRRFESATALPPRLIDDGSSSSEEEGDEEPTTPPSLPSEAELKRITQGPGNDGLADLYQSLQRCPCHGHQEDGPQVEKVWDIPQKESYEGRRLAVVQVAA